MKNKTSHCYKNRVSKHSVLTGLWLSLLTFCGAMSSEAGNDRFIKRSVDKLYEDVNHNGQVDSGEEFRFISYNVAEALLAGKHDITGVRRIPDEFEMRDTVETAVQMGARVFRTYTFYVTSDLAKFQAGLNGSGNPFHLYSGIFQGAGLQFNEEAFRQVDKLIQVCNEKGIRLIIPFVDGAGWGGWPTTYGSDFFVTNSAANINFKNMIRYVLNRTNYYTGVQYKDEKAILCWESGNEVKADTDDNLDLWASDLANFIKGIDSNHLFMDGRNQPARYYNRYTVMDNENIDILSYHTYSSLPGMDAVQSLKAMRNYTAGKKVLNIGEITMDTPNSTLSDLLNEVISGGANSAMYWALRYRNRDGGFYHHSQFQDLHWPGFPGASLIHSDIQTEFDRLNIIADKAYQIQGLTRPALPISAAPVLLPIADVGHINWQGPTGAQSFDIERATHPAGPWTVVQSNFYDVLIVDGDLFCDETAEIGQSYYYRVKAKNSSGASPYSNIVGPVFVRANWLVDELFNDAKMHSRSANTQIRITYRAEDNNQDDIARLRRTTATQEYVVYHVPGEMDYFKVWAYGTNSDFSFSASADGTSYSSMTPVGTEYGGGGRKLYEALSVPAGTSYLKIQFENLSNPTSTSLGRIEIRYADASSVANPSIRSHPASVNTAMGSDVSFSVTPRGTSPFYYQWQKDGTNTGSDSATLSLSNVQPADAGSYQVVVSNVYGSVTSSTATLTVSVLVAPSISVQPLNQAVAAGGQAAFSVVAGGSLPLFYQWKQGVSNIGSNAPTLLISNVQSANVGNYKVVITNVAGSVTSSVATLTLVTNLVELIVEEHFTDRNGTGSIGVTSWPKGTITTGLSYSGITSTGGALKSANTFGNTAIYNGTGYGDSTLWFSVMVKNTIDQDRLLFFGAGISSTGVGVDFTTGKPRATIGLNYATNTVTITPTDVNFIVGKMVLSSTGNETVTIWANPTNFTSEAAMTNSAIGSSTVTAAGTLTLSTNSMIYPRMAGTNTVFDEIRLGTNLTSVVPTPGGEDPAIPYDIWAQSHGLTQGAQGDDDQDGQSNFIEYALGSNPTNGSNRAQVGFAPAGTSGFEYVYVRRTTQNSGVGYRLELTTNLVSGVWTTNGYLEMPTESLDADFEVVTNQIITDQNPEKFIRLKIFAVNESE